MTDSPPLPSLYPPAPVGVPPDLARPDAAYRTRAAGLILGLGLFAAFYLLLLAGVCYLAYRLFLVPLPEAKERGAYIALIAVYGGGAALVLLAVFLVKGLFKGRRAERTGHLPLDPADHPHLFAFIRRVYADAGAPPPRRVYVSPEVNAALIYNTSVLNLVVPPKKDLLIGLGLVNVVTLAEFKAVLAHEFGHFAQRSVGLGSYLYVANRVMHDVIYGRDALDKVIDAWASIDIRVSFPAWGVKAALWAIRGVLAKVYNGLNLMHLSLGRQMEFNADSVAVRLTGSDALIHGLARLEFAGECLADAARSLSAAADHGVQTDDVFVHQTASADRLRRLRKDPRLGLPPDLPDDPAARVAVFEPVPDGIPEKYRTHPTHHQREQNAKRVYVRSPQDDRSPWLLFADPAGLKRAVSERFYKEALARPDVYAPLPAAEVQAFIDAEHAEATYDPRYHGLYDDRFVAHGDLAPVAGNAWDADRLAGWFAGWPPADLQQRMTDHATRQGEAHMLNGLNSGEYTLKGKTFTFREQEYTARDVRRLAEQVDGELTASHDQLQALDRDVFLAHWSLARQLDAADGGGREAELLERYRFHAAVQGLLGGLLGDSARLRQIVALLQQAAGQPIDADTFHQILATLRGISDTVSGNLADAHRFRAPALVNVPAGTPLSDLLAERSALPALPPPDADTITGEWIGRVGQRLDDLLGRVKRVHFKSLGGLLRFQERLADAGGFRPPDPSPGP